MRAASTLRIPPRVRRGRFAGTRRRSRRRNTSARAEKTRRGRKPRLRNWEHLRACGEDAYAFSRRAAEAGTPPRVRRRHLVHRSFLPFSGNTSARAEKTTGLRRPWGCVREHLRACGEDLMAEVCRDVGRGTPPRVRRRHDHGRDPGANSRNTSARAEKTALSSPTTCWSREHLRACGEDASGLPLVALFLGTPPRVRRRRGERGWLGGLEGNTSARAEKTLGCLLLHRRGPEHLRACGEDSRFT